MKRTIDDALSILSDKTQKVIRCYYYENLTFEQIAERIGYKSKQATEVLHYQALHRLRHCSHTPKLKALLAELSEEEFDLEASAFLANGYTSYRYNGSNTENIALQL